MISVTWSTIASEVENLCRRLPADLVGVYGIPTGGCFVAVMVNARAGFPILDEPCRGCYVLDDLIDTGETLKRYAEYPCDTLYRKPHSPEVCRQATVFDDWIQFPWEHSGGPLDAVTRLLEFAGTPEQVARWGAIQDEKTREDITRRTAWTLTAILDHFSSSKAETRPAESLASIYRQIP
jgi:hypothetical protein